MPDMSPLEAPCGLPLASLHPLRRSAILRSGHMQSINVAENVQGAVLTVLRQLGRCQPRRRHSACVASVVSARTRLLNASGTGRYARGTFGLHPKQAAVVRSTTAWNSGRVDGDKPLNKSH
jgi:hypothetical protein